MLSALEGVVEVFLPSRDPAGTIPIARVASKRDKPLAVPALADVGFIHLKTTAHPVLAAAAHRDAASSVGLAPLLGPPLYETLHGIKKGLKDVLQPQVLFEDLGIAISALQTARQEARRQQLYIETVVSPHKPDEAIEPRSTRYVLTILVVSLAAYSMLWLVISGSREHMHG